MPKKLPQRYEVAANGCWIWLGGKISTGYGTRAINKKKVLTHRYEYEKKFGPISLYLVIDHLCNNRICCNPDHMQVTTRGKNVLRGSGICAMKARQTHCIYGHEFTSDNIYKTKRGTKRCLTCMRIRNRGGRPGAKKIKELDS